MNKVKSTYNYHLLSPFDIDECMKLVNDYKEGVDDIKMFIELMKLKIFHISKEYNFMNITEMRKINECERKMKELKIFHPSSRGLPNRRHRIKPNIIKTYSKVIEDYALKCENSNLDKILILPHGKEHQRKAKLEKKFINNVLYLDIDRYVKPDIVMDMYVLVNWELFPNNYFDRIHFQSAPMCALCKTDIIDNIVSFFICVIDKIDHMGKLTFNHKLNDGKLYLMECIDEAKHKCNKLDISVDFGPDSYDDLKQKKER